MPVTCGLISSTATTVSYARLSREDQAVDHQVDRAPLHDVVAGRTEAVGAVDPQQVDLTAHRGVGLAGVLADDRDAVGDTGELGDRQTSGAVGAIPVCRR